MCGDYCLAGVDAVREQVGAQVRVGGDVRPVDLDVVAGVGDHGQALAAVLGGTQSLHTNSFDEALGLPATRWPAAQTCEEV